jgi:hypothetical protein
MAQTSFAASNDLATAEFPTGQTSSSYRNEDQFIKPVSSQDYHYGARPAPAEKTHYHSDVHAHLNRHLPKCK